MADKRMREAAVEASKMKDPTLMKEGEEPEMDDIFTDFLKEEQSKVLFLFFLCLFVRFFFFPFDSMCFFSFGRPGEFSFKPIMAVLFVYWYSLGDT